MPATVLGHLLADVVTEDRVSQDFVELFAGEAAVSTGLRFLGMSGESLDMRRVPSVNFMDPEGFNTTLRAIWSLREWALVVPRSNQRMRFNNATEAPPQTNKHVSRSPTSPTTKEGGLFWAAPPCSTWVWMSRGSTGRHRW
jgi:hypothetical protein